MKKTIKTMISLAICLVVTLGMMSTAFAAAVFVENEAKKIDGIMYIGLNQQFNIGDYLSCTSDGTGSALPMVLESGDIDTSNVGDVLSLTYKAIDPYDNLTIRWDVVIIVGIGEIPVLTVTPTKTITASEKGKFNPKDLITEASRGDSATLALKDDVIITDKLTGNEITTELDTSKATTYNLKYTLVDSDGNTIFEEATIIVQNPESSSTVTSPPASGSPLTINDPFIYLNGPNSNITSTPPPPANNIKDAVINARDIKLKVGDTFDFMKGVTARDDGGKGQNITNDVTISGSVNTSVPGKFTVTYKVTGANGKTVSKRITVTIVDDAGAVKYCS